MPCLEISLSDLIFDPNVQTYCISPNFKCPSYGHSWACPPEAPYLEELVSTFNKFYLIYYKLNLDEYIEKNQDKYPELSVSQLKNKILIGNFLQNKLENDICEFLERNQGKFKEKLVLWDGYCRICFNERDKGCTYDSGQPCRYPDKKRYSMEAVGIDVNKTTKNLKIAIEWPPENHVFRFGLVCFK
ncbi:MAG: DUF2284 domain-containing protein [Promethearchaeota archaeon]